MASIGSLPFTVETKSECSAFLHSKNQHRPGSSITTFRLRKSPVFTVFNNSICGFSLRSGRRGQSWRNKHVKAAETGYFESENGNEPEDALEATIAKSKKVLAMQRELLHQIAERRKLVSSIKGSIANPEEEVSYEQRENSFPNLDLSSASGSNVVEDQSTNFSSSSYDNSTAKDVQENQPSGVITDSNVGGKESGNILPPKRTSINTDSLKRSKDTNTDVQEIVPSRVIRDSNVGGKESGNGLPPKRTFINADSPKQLKDSESAWSTELPSFLSRTSEISSLKDEEHEDLKDSSLQEVTSEATDPTADDAKLPPLAGANVMNVILVAAECAPWSKTGGLGDVAGSLPKALARRGHRVMVVAPRYGNYAEAQDCGVRIRYKVDRQDVEVAYFQTFIDGVDFVFIDCHMFRHMENNIYAGKREDILKRMVLFCKAAVEVPWHVPCGGVCYGDGNLVFIANDWHTALLPVYLKAYYRDNGLMKYTRSMLVIHNIAHQGRGPVEDFSFVDLPEHYLDLFRLYDPIGGDHFNIFAAGLKAADRVVTVSHGYSWEVRTSEGGWGLHNIINENDWKLRGIVNGIDTKEWSPQRDVHLTSDGYTNYSIETLDTGKPQCKAALQKELGLPVREDVPLIGFIGRLDHQKGVDLIAEAIPWMMGQDVQLVMLGTGRPDLEEMLKHVENQHRDKVRGWVGFSVKTAHRITAGADILLMPSRFEPCGLNQLYAMNYGTIPVVHAVGGLRDTVQPFNPFNESGLGWTFDSAETGKLIHALGNCLLTYREYKKSWEGLQRRGMMQDLSWDNAAQNYEEVLVAAKYQW
ncbi:hypothetical protein ACOSP7_027993 [Xanthoceras sorbifolium]|uniref:Starch synthase catalytic domain-containing protein n=1 Tax=Xanthoceras sorbifolium TaxID=99658 RepID=A0ABQ8HDL2_9ROSI|nr:hypothetical protein JRO89_XS12G0238400 [Xanthoceras sorbifolium]